MIWLTTPIVPRPLTSGMSPGSPSLGVPGYQPGPFTNILIAVDTLSALQADLITWTKWNNCK